MTGETLEEVGTLNPFLLISRYYGNFFCFIHIMHSKLIWKLTRALRTNAIMIIC